MRNKLAGIAHAPVSVQMHYKKAPRSDDAIPFLGNSRSAVLAVKVRFARAFRATLTASVRTAPSAPLGRNGISLKWRRLRLKMVNAFARSAEFTTG